MATRFNEGEMSFSSCKNLVLIEGSKRSKSSNIAAGTSMALRKTRSDQIAGLAASNERRTERCGHPSSHAPEVPCEVP